MYARLLTLRVREGNFDQVLRIIRELVIPAAERQEGFTAFILLCDQEAGKICTTTLWDTESDMLASERSEYFQEQISRFITLLAGPPQIERYRVDTLS